MAESVIKLIKQQFNKNEYGVPVPTPDYTEIFCEVQDVTRSEFYGSGRSGLNESFMARIFSAEYSGETVVEYEGETYSIYRKYEIPGTDYTELYFERKGGTNGKKENNG